MERLDLDLLMMRLNACMSSGRHSEARRLLDQVLDLEPMHPAAHGMMGWIMWALVGDTERALTHFRLAVRGHADLNTWMHYLNLLVALGMGDELHAAYHQALAVNGIDRAHVHASVARFLERTGQRSQAAVIYGHAMREATSFQEERGFREARIRVRGGTLRQRMGRLLAML